MTNKQKIFLWIMGVLLLAYLIFSETGNDILKRIGMFIVVAIILVGLLFVIFSLICLVTTSIWFFWMVLLGSSEQKHFYFNDMYYDDDLRFMYVFDAPLYSKISCVRKLFGMSKEHENAKMFSFNLKRIWKKL